MSNSRYDDDSDRVFIRSKWGTSRYVYNPRNPVGLTLIISSLLFAVGGMYLVHHPDLLKASDRWSESELREAVSAATDELASEALFGPGGVASNYGEILRARIAEQGDHSEDGLTVTLASERPESALFDGGAEWAYYTVRADGTDAAFCLSVDAMKRKREMGYEFVTIDVDYGACPAS
ncbi:hypothetical protein U9R90_29645 [Streptomyces sp. E11-3]|uniref:hypothetical protein n=1 Tax=Streptomyces sp. E11-3 TaxID=3110112 RepID=UPI003980B5C7